MDFTRRTEDDKYIKLTDKNGYVTIIDKEAVMPIADALIKYIDKVLKIEVTDE